MGIGKIKLQRALDGGVRRGRVTTNLNLPADFPGAMCPPPQSRP